MRTVYALVTFWILLAANGGHTGLYHGFDRQDAERPCVRCSFDVDDDLCGERAEAALREL